MPSGRRNLISTGSPITYVRPDTPFKHVVARVRAVGAVPVTDDSGLVLGMVGERDLLATKGRLEGLPGRLAAARRHGGRGTAASLMSSPAVMTRAEATTGDAARLMYRHRLGSLPVVDWLGRLVGIISEGDVLDGFTRRDADIHREVVRGVIAREFLLDPLAFTVSVRDGVVTLSGRPETDQVGHLLAAAVRRVEGVVELRDQMRYTAEGTVLSPPLPWLSRAVAALTLAFR